MPAQVAADIEADIDAGTLTPDTRLPSESELATQYGVARVSVRRAIEKLRDWRKSTYSDATGGQCVETAGDGGAILVHDTTQRSGVVLAVPAEAWRSFITRLR